MPFGSWCYRRLRAATRTRRPPGAALAAPERCRMRSSWVIAAPLEPLGRGEPAVPSGLQRACPRDPLLRFLDPCLGAPASTFARLAGHSARFAHHHAQADPSPRSSTLARSLKSTRVPLDVSSESVLLGETSVATAQRLDHNGGLRSPSSEQRTPWGHGKRIFCPRGVSSHPCRLRSWSWLPGIPARQRRCSTRCRARGRLCTSLEIRATLPASCASRRRVRWAVIASGTRWRRAW